MSWFDAIERGMLRWLSPGGARGLSILIYHRVLPAADPLFPDALERDGFAAQLALLKQRFHVLPLLEAVRLARAGRLPPRAACITFDDGYADNAEVALPLLQQHGLHATFFIATGFLNGGRMWNDTIIETVRRAPHAVLDARPLGLGSHPLGSMQQRRQALASLIGQLKYQPMAQRQVAVDQLAQLAGVPLPTDLMMSDAQVRQLHAAGMGIGGHTVNHPILARLPADEARREIADGKQALERLLGAPVELFAYPNGKPDEDYRAEHVAMVQELGFEAAVSTAWGASRAPDFFQLPRFTPWDRHPRRFTLRLARNLRQQAALAA